MIDVLDTFKTLIRQRYGLTLEGIDDQRLRAILHSTHLIDSLKPGVSVSQLSENSANVLDDVVSQLTVNETYFFRDPEQITLAVETIIPRVAAFQGTERRLRLLSAGCSSGEEPYSLAIALTEKWGDRVSDKFEIYACDLDRQILAKARHGLYSNFSFRGVDQDLRKRYFEPVGQRFLLTSELRRLVHFFELNLLAASYPGHLPRYDLIFFRNVSIYFDPQTRAIILAKLSNLLADDGVLIVGSSETLANDLGIFNLVEEQGHYYFIKGRRLQPPHLQPVSPVIIPESVPTACDAPPQATRAPVQKTNQEAPVIQPHTTSPPASPTTIRELILQDDTDLAFGQLQRLFDQQDMQSRDGDQARLLSAWISGNRKQFSQALEQIQIVLEKQPWNLDALILEGLLARWQEHHQDAHDRFKRAVYICPDSWPACYYLAETQRALHQPAAAIRSYQIVRRLLSGKSHAKTGLDILPLSLTPTDALFLTEHQLLRLNQQTLASGVS